MKNRKGLNRNGHLIFSISLLIIAYFFLKNYFGDYLNIFLSLIPLHLLPFLFGAIFPDIIESPKVLGINHRSFFHSQRIMWILLIILIPLTIFLAIKTPEKYIFNIPFNYYSLGAAFCLGVLTHLLGDSLTSKLRK